MTDSFADLARQRRSIRRYLNVPVPSERLTEILSAATWAPSAHNRQPWRFVVITTTEIKESLASAMGRSLADDLAGDGVDPAAIERDVQRSYLRLTSAPVVIVVCLTMVDMDRYADPHRSRCEWIMAAQSTAMAGQNLLLAASDVGLGACWMCAPLFCPDIVRTTLDLPADWEPQGLITLGYPAEEKDRTRRLLREVWIAR